MRNRVGSGRLKCSSSGAGWGSSLAGVVYPAGPDGPVVAGGPVGPCEMPSPSSEKSQDPLEHAVLIHADPAGQDAAVGTLSPSDCYPAGPAVPYVAGGPVGPDDYLQVLEPFEQLVLDHADPAGQHAVIRIQWIHWSIRIHFRIRFWTVDWLRRSQIGSRRQVWFQTLTWMVDLWRGLLTWSTRLWGCLWRVDSWRDVESGNIGAVSS